MMAPDTTADIFHAAAHGDIDLVRRLLDGPDAPRPNEVDDMAHSACFYAQLMGHSEVARVLEERGWETIPAENIFIGPGGRRCYWADAHIRATPARCLDRATGLDRAHWTDARNATARLDEPLAKPPAVSRKKEKVRFRQLGRSGRLIEFTPRDHPLYRRLAPGRGATTRGAQLPALNCNDICCERVLYEPSAWHTPSGAGMADEAEQWEHGLLAELYAEHCSSSAEDAAVTAADAAVTAADEAGSAGSAAAADEWVVVLDDLPEGALPQASAATGGDGDTAAELASVAESSGTEAWLEVPTRPEALGQWATPLRWDGVAPPTPPAARRPAPAAAPWPATYHEELRAYYRRVRAGVDALAAEDDWRCVYYDDLKSMGPRSTHGQRGRARPLCA